MVLYESIVFCSKKIVMKWIRIYYSGVRCRQRQRTKRSMISVVFTYFCAFHLHFYWIFASRWNYTRLKIRENVSAVFILSVPVYLSKLFKWTSTSPRHTPYRCACGRNKHLSIAFTFVHSSILSKRYVVCSLEIFFSQSQLSTLDCIASFVH